MKLSTSVSRIRRYLHNVYSVDFRSLAIFRIAVGLVVLIDLVRRFQHSLTFYSDAGVLPRRDAFASLSQFRWSVLFANGTPEFVNFVFIVGLIAATAMILGWRTRLATVVLWVIVMSLQSRNPHLSSGADTLMRVSLFWAMLLPLGRNWSLDAHFSRSEDNVPVSDEKANRFSSLATFGLILQVSCVYLFTAIQKDGPRWREEGTALYFALGARDVSSDLGDWLFRNAPDTVLAALTYSSLLLEFAIPIMLLLPLRSGWMRTAGVFLIVTFHIGIGMTMTVGLFPAISIASAVGVLPTWFWEKVTVRVPSASMVHWLKQRLSRLNFPLLPDSPPTQLKPTHQNAALVNTDTHANRALHFIHSPWNNRMQLSGLIGNVGAAVAIVLMLAWNIQTVSSYQTSPTIRQAAISTGLYQNWSMFAPGPQTASIWFVVEGELESGEKVDLLVPIFNDDVSLRQPATWDQSDEIVLKDKYWRKYFHAIRGDKTDTHRFAAYTCRTWNADNTGDERLDRITLTRGVASTRLDGVRAEPVYDQMGSWNCT